MSIDIGSMVRGKNMKSNYYNDTVRPLTEVLVVTALDGETITAQNGARDIYTGRVSEFTPVFQHLIAYHYNDIDLRRANAAHNNTSWTPERRGYLYADGYVSTMEEMDEHFSEFATDETRDALVAGLERFRVKYLEYMWAYLSAKGNCISAAITGPSNFPVRRAEKATRSCENRHNEWVEWEKKARKRLEETYNPKVVEHAPIMSGDADALDKLREKLRKLEADHAMMKAVNAICRAKKTSDDEKRAALRSQGFSDPLVAALLHPQYSYEKPGFQSWQLSNNNAEIRRIQGRIKQLETVKAHGSSETEIAGVTITANADAHRVQVAFPGKPSAECRAALKSNGFRWAPSLSVWQAYLSPRAEQAAQRIVNEHYQ